MNEEKKVSDSDLISFDNFPTIANVADIWDAQFMQIKDMSIVYLQYAKDAEGYQHAEEFNTPNFLTNAFANIFKARRIKSVDREKSEENVFVFDGILWIRPKVFTEDIYGIGGRILCYRPSVNNLSALIRGNAKTNDELEKRVLKIRQSYIEQRRKFREQERGSYARGMSEGHKLASIRD